MNELISFIIPVYNTELYIGQCVSSILSQDYKNIELILIDDGSVDLSPTICDEWAIRDNRVKVVHKSNGGLSDARNLGLNTATGEYVIFIDSDDFWVGQDSLRLLLFEINAKKFDFLCFNCSYYYPSLNKYKKWKLFEEELLECTDKNKMIINLVKSGNFPMSACMKIIKRSFLLKNKIIFQKGIIAEDIPWFMNLLEMSEKFGFLNKYIYAYRKEVRTSISSLFSEKMYNDLFNIFRTELSRIENLEWRYETKNALMSFWAYEYCTLLGLSYFFQSDIRKKEFFELQKYRWILKYQLHPKVRKVLVIIKLIGLPHTVHFLNMYMKYCLGIRSYVKSVN